LSWRGSPLFLVGSGGLGDIYLTIPLMTG